MKWLLVTTNPTPFLPKSAHPHGAGWNVGDQFARVGTEQLVYEADPQAEIELVNMDVAESFIPERKFDRAIFAGRPMFWHDAPKHPLWVHLLNGWLCRDPRKVLALGVGDCFPASAEWFTELEHQIYAASLRMWRLVLRSSHVVPAGVDVSVCPGAWAIADRAEVPEEKLCNFMPGGAHYPEFDRFEAGLWSAQERANATLLKESGFEFVAHTLQEVELAYALGWRSVYFSSSVEGYLRIYARASNYIGNRMHGAIILGGRNAVAAAIGYDSRLLSAMRAGAIGLKPSDLNPGAIRELVAQRPGYAELLRVKRIRAERSRMLQLVKEFAS